MASKGEYSVTRSEETAAANQHTCAAEEVATLIAELATSSLNLNSQAISRELQARCPREVSALASHLRPYASFCARHRHIGLPAAQETIFAYLADCENSMDIPTVTGLRLAAIAVAHCLRSNRPTVQRRMYLALPKILRSYILIPGSTPADVWKCWEHKLKPKNSLEQTFSDIYLQGAWGVAPGEGFYSGTGSHKSDIIMPYLAAVRQFARNIPIKPTAVDLGCGDFNVGKRIFDEFYNYIACDIVSSLIDRNNETYKYNGLEFSHVNIVDDCLPLGDVAILRQVLQHLSNEEILQILPKLYQYKYLVLTEHIPSGSFIPNMNKPSGYDVRADFGSGVVLSAPPFSLASKSEKILCEVPEHNGVVRTTAYRLK
ncbi:class I SAM-dependent methyltransferase [Sphingomonas gei]|uniref:Class I SAM-dependent methyltransferase n=1 Tax=Sphingomonas gei TaxID=1395960 RepID=A0A4S1WYP7_9SPHN|nr:class I SAM-dependent methyltransferase [Sphingomonas gei]TGX48668.1 class I SAM-dependent methyltransferase [Sphingomonas gei]